MNPNSSVLVLGKISALLDRLAEEGEANAARLAELVDEPRSTVYRLLTSMNELGLVENGAGQGTYRLGLRLFRLGSTVITRFNERQAALPVMERIHDETGETVFLCIRRGREAVCIERLDGRRVQSLALRLGGSLPLHAGAAPRALLASEPREQWLEYLSAGGLEAFTPSTPTDADRLLPLLEQTLDSGYALSDQDVTIGIAALGAPILGFDAKARAALSISGVREAILGDDADAIRALILGGAAEISRELGYAADNHGEVTANA